MELKGTFIGLHDQAEVKAKVTDVRNPNRLPTLEQSLLVLSFASSPAFPKVLPLNRCLIWRVEIILLIEEVTG